MTPTIGWRGANEPEGGVVVLNRFYAPDHAATAQMLSDLAVGLSKKGWQVTVIAGAVGYDGQRSDGPRDDIIDGVRVYRVPSTAFGRDHLLGRMMDYLSYSVLTFWRVMRISRPRVIVAMSDPPFILVVGAIAASLRGAMLCHWAQDVYPALAARLGVLKEQGLAFRLLSSVSRRLLRACDLVVGLGPRMTEALIEGGAPPDRTICIHNWADENAIRPIGSPDNWFVATNNLEHKFVVLYSGNAGRGHTFDALCTVMDRFRDDDQIVFVFIGGGRKSNELRAFAETRNLQNALFLDYLPRGDLAYSLSAASVSVVTEHPSVAGLLLPSKTYGILASGRPIIFIGSANSDVAEIVRSAQCGVVVAPDDPDSLERVINELRRDPSIRSQMGAAARNAAEASYSRESAIAEWSAALSRDFRTGFAVGTDSVHLGNR